MFLLKKFSLCFGIFIAAGLLNGCSSAVFPALEDSHEILVGEGGRVIRSAPEESSSLKADEENAAYEGEDSDDEIEELAAKEETAVSEPVIADLGSDVSEPTVSETLEMADFTPVDENNGPSISYRLDTFYFENGSSVLDSKYNAALRKIVKTVKDNDAAVIVYGYASSRTRNTDAASHKLANFKVSTERAESVAAALRRAGLPAAKISIEALSDTAPMYQEVMPEGERLNRRAEVYIVY